MGKILCAAAVHTTQTPVLFMGGVNKAQKIVAVNSWLQRSLSSRVDKARTQLFLSLELVTPTNATARHHGTSTILGMIIGQQVYWGAAVAPKWNTSDGTRT